MKGSPMAAVEGDRSLARISDVEPRQLLALAAVVAALLFGVAGVIGAIGYTVSVIRNR